MNTGLHEINKLLVRLRKHTGKTYRSDKWSDYNYYQYLDLKRRVLNDKKNS